MHSLKKTAAAALLACVLVACGKKSEAELPSDFNSMSDSAKVEWLISQKVAPDSVARFIGRASLGEIRGVKIDTLSNALLFAYEKYRGDDLATFSSAFDDYKSSLPLDKKMSIYLLSGETDDMGVGYQLGLEFVSTIREQQLDAAQIRKQIEALRKASAGAPDTYTRFVKGFKLALEADRGKDLDEKIYNEFINLQ